MNTIANRLTHIVMIAAVLAALFMIAPAKAASATAGAAASAKAAPVVMLPRVVVTGHRVLTEQIVYLPRVVVVGKRVDSTDSMQARKTNTVLVATR